jgi:hypothetical protein
MDVVHAEWMTNREPRTRFTPTSDDSSVANIAPFQRHRGSGADLHVTTTWRPLSAAA